jgi:hypothetical protein
MSLLQDLLKETSVTTADNIAGDRGMLFSGGAVDASKQNKQKFKMLRRIGYINVDEIVKIKQSNKWKNILEGDNTTFDQTDVISKLDAAEKRAKADKDTVVFGMEDENGKIVKVYVRAEQSDDFEAALGTMLAGNDEGEDGENSAVEIAEVLFNLRDKFEIVDVEWGMIEGDEEQEQELAGDDAGGELEDPEGGEDMDADGEDMDDGGELDDEGTDDTEEDAKTALQSVIDVMKADAEAKQAEAKARQAEADSETAKYAANAADSKIRQEEQILDMEAHEKSKSDASKESKTLAKLAKYKHETQGDDYSVSENEETDDDSSESKQITKDELAALILKHMAHN